MKHYLLFLLCFAYSSITFGQNLVTYDFTSQPGDQASTNPSSTAANMFASAITRGTGVTASAASNTMSSNNWTTGTIDLNDYYELTLTPLGGYALDLDNLNFRERRSNTGIRNFEVRTSLDGYSASYFSTAVPDDNLERNQTFTFPAAFSSITSAITIRIYGYNAEAATGTWQLRNNSTTNNFSITGSVSSTSPPDINLNFDDTGYDNIAQGSDNNVVFRVFAQVSTADATLNQVSLRTTGTYASSDVKANGFKLWYSTDNFLNAADTEIASVGSVSGNGETITFTGLSQSLLTSTFNFLFVTVDIDASATLSNTIQIDNTTIADFTFAVPSNKTGTSNTGNLHTIVGLQTGTVSTSLCVTSTESEPINVPFTYVPTSTYTGTTFLAQLSDASGSFLSATTIGSVTSDDSGSQTISATIPANTPQGSNYRVRVISSAPSVDGADNGSDITIDLLNVSITPSTTQTLEEFQNGDLITANESHAVQARRWKYATSSGGPYTNFLGADPTERPYFETNGTYYIVVETEFTCGKSSVSNEVQVNVSDFLGTRLFPGDLVIIGWDLNTSSGAGSGDDEFVLTNLVPLTQGTTFQVVNATYENGAVDNVRQDQWQDTKIMEFTYKLATPLAAGSTISFELPVDFTSPAANIRINNVVVPASTLEGVRLSSEETGSGGVNVSSSGADQIFITQGNLQGTDFDGYVLFGMTHLSDWIDFSIPVSTPRTSRTPNNIKCLNISHPTAVGGSYYSPSALRNGSQREILASIINMANWTDIATSSTGRDIPASIRTNTFTITPNTIAEIEWIGGNSGTNDDNWFNCQNWENFYVPNRRQDVIMTTTAVDGSRINVGAFFSDEYNDLAEVRNITLEEQRLVINDARTSQLNIYENLLIRNNGFLDMQDAIDFVEDGTINIRGHWTNEIGTAAFQEGQSLIVFEGGGNQVITTAGGEESFFDVVINTGGGVTLNNEAIITTFTDGANIRGGNVEFITGNIFSNNSAHSVTFTEEATYEGASKTRHIRGAARRISDKVEDFIFPIGKNGVYRPAIVHTQSGGSITTFFAEYYDNGYGTYNPVISPLAFVSQVEYWMINRESGLANAEVTLSWGPTSFVKNPASLAVAHWTDEVVNPVGEEWVSRGQSFLGTGFFSGTTHTQDIITGGAGPSTLEGRIRSAQTITAFSPFTLGSIDFTNLLPVTWLSFDAKYNQEQQTVLLEWATASETKNQSFMIERSENGTDFQEIGTQNGAFNSNAVQKYQFLDFEPLRAKTYYRIKQMDIDGNSSYSNIKMVEVSSQERVGITHYQTQTILYANLEQATKAKINIYDIRGNNLGVFDVVLEKGQNQIPLPIQTLSKTIYLYKIELENQSDFVSGKFLVN